MFRKFALLLLLAAACSGVTVPRPAGDVPFTIPGKGPDKLANYKGKVVMLVIFMTTCPHCQKTTDLLTSMQRDYKAQGLQVIELAFRPEDNDDAIRQFVAAHKTNFPVGQIDPEVMAAFGQLTAEMRPTVPIVFLIDREGMVRAQYLGGDPMMEEQYQDQNLRAKLMQYLPGGGTGAKSPVRRAATKAK